MVHLPGSELGELQDPENGASMRSPCGRLAIPTDGFCLQFTGAKLMQGTASLWSFDAHQPTFMTIVGYNSSGSGWSFSITVASDSMGNLEFGDGWVMSLLPQPSTSSG